MTDIIEPAIVKDPNKVEACQEMSKISQELFGIRSFWQTPGIYITEAIKNRPEVKYIGEKYQEDYLQTVIVLTEDPEDLLDIIFTTEHKLYKKFKNLRFDIRVRVVSQDEDISVLKRSTAYLFEKQI